ncbi:MAG: hypothetical protein KDJ65_28295 [Anaerolineae bacterium]|nr:hypothetical protein [Anaerolineae bacterium]
MDIGPIQMVVVGFDRIDRFKGEIMHELEKLSDSGVIRVLDLLFVMKDETGGIISFTGTDLSPEEEAQYGAVIEQMLGLRSAEGAAGDSTAGSLALTDHDYGLTPEDIQEVAAQIEPGKAAGFLLVEHKWATGFKHAVGDAGGRMVAQGFLTPHALWMVGKELEAMVEAEEAIEMAEAVKGAAMLDALITVAQAEEVKEAAIEEAAEAVVMSEMVKTMAAVEAVQALIVAGMIEDAAAQRAIDALVTAGMIEAAAVSEAEDVVAQATAVAAAALADAEGNGADGKLGNVGEPA